MPDESNNSLLVVYLDPKWGNRLVSAPSSLWPTWATPNDAAYRCEVLNNADVPLYGLSLRLAATFRQQARVPASREIEVSFPTSVEPHRGIEFYIADDTRIATEVALPVNVAARVGAAQESQTISARYSTNEGGPIKLRGFNP